MGESRREVLAAMLGLAGCASGGSSSQPPPKAPPKDPPRAAEPNGREPLNVVVILTDDQRYDSLGFMGRTLAKTPHLDALAASGAHFAEAFVTTSLCCPSRASMLTGLYAHAHGVLDNSAELSPQFASYAQIAQGAGIETAYIGKWHMGAGNPHPRPGFDRWIGFRGQGRYHYPGDDPDPLDRALSFDGDLREVKGYITDLLTDYAVEYIRSRAADKPFLLVLSHKGVHSPFVPAERHKGLFADTTAIPTVLSDDDASYEGLPAFFRQIRRETEFSADHPYKTTDFRSWYLDYERTLCAIDDSVGRVKAALEDKGLTSRTAIVFASDNGFQLGERGIVDKRNFTEPSIRVPLLLSAPGLARAGVRIDEIALNVDIAPTVLDLCGLRAPSHWHGRSLLPLLQGSAVDWRQDFLYEYFYERAFPHTPTLFGLRTKSQKLALYYGLSERGELYDLREDPAERLNRYADPAWASQVKPLRARLAQQAEQLGLLTEPVWGSNWVAPPEQAARAAGETVAPRPSKQKSKGKQKAG